jgi:hypothetical protein
VPGTAESTSNDHALEDKVVEMKIVERASDNTIGRVLKKTFSSRI